MSTLFRLFTSTEVEDSLKIVEVVPIEFPQGIESEDKVIEEYKINLSSNINLNSLYKKR